MNTTQRLTPNEPLQRFDAKLKLTDRERSLVLKAPLAESFEVLRRGVLRAVDDAQVFRSAALTRTATLAPKGRISREVVREEIGRLRESWGAHVPREGASMLAEIMTDEELDGLDLFDLVQLETVVRVCRESKSLSDAGRKLFASSRERRRSTNDSDRVRKYLAKFGLNWDRVNAS